MSRLLETLEGFVVPENYLEALTLEECRPIRRVHGYEFPCGMVVSLEFAKERGPLCYLLQRSHQAHHDDQHQSEPGWLLQATVDEDKTWWKVTLTCWHPAITPTQMKGATQQ